MFTGAHTQSEGDQWVVDLAGMLKDTAFEQLLTSYNVQVPATVRVPVTVSTPKVLQPGQLRPLATWGLWASIGVVVLAALCALLTLAAARNRGRALASLGISAMLVGAAVGQPSNWLGTRSTTRSTTRPAVCAGSPT